MEIIISESKISLGKQAASKGAELIRNSIEMKGEANIILATGASQFEMLSELVKENINWSRVRAFHLDEYIGIPDTHPASFCKYLKERFADIVLPMEFNYINGNAKPEKECTRLGKKIKKHLIDVAFVGIGENGHLAFNDPPADFESENPYIIVTLDEACRRQQLGEGWFSSILDVPGKAISMSIKQIMKSRAIICCVPDLRKARAIRQTLESEISADIPASILRNHEATWLYLDKDSSSLLTK